VGRDGKPIEPAKLRTYMNDEEIKVIVDVK
jgi:hypothetical protein